MMSRFERVKLLAVLLGGMWAVCPTLAPAQSCTKYKFSKEGWDIVRQVVEQKVTDADVLKKAAEVVAPTWAEVFGPTTDRTPPFLIFGRSDMVGDGLPSGNKKLFYNYDTCQYPRAYFHAGLGAWQLDTRGMAKSLAAYEAVMPETAVPVVIGGLGTDAKTFCRWFGCFSKDAGTCNRCCNSKCNEKCECTGSCGQQDWCRKAADGLNGICPDGKFCPDDTVNKICPDDTVKRMGGVVKWRCSWHGQDIDCYWLNPDIAEGRYGWAYSNPNGSCEPGGKTPLPAGFLNFKDTTYEYRVWPRLGTGYDQDIWARRPLERDARKGLEWNLGIAQGLVIRGLVAPSSAATPEKLDVVLLIDTTGSMWDDIAAAAHSAKQIVTKLFEKEGLDVDVRVALAEYKDFPWHLTESPATFLTARSKGLRSKRTIF